VIKNGIIYEHEGAYAVANILDLARRIPLRRNSCAGKDSLETDGVVCARPTILVNVTLFAWFVLRVPDEPNTLNRCAVATRRGYLLESIGSRGGAYNTR
jgi:hypothetical protein